MTEPTAEAPEPGTLADPDLGIPGDAEPEPGDIEADVETEVNDETDDDVIEQALDADPDDFEEGTDG